MPYKITRLESYKADQTKSGDSLKHYGRKGMKWGKEVFGKDDIPGQSRSSSSGAPPSKALSSVLNTRVTTPHLLNSTHTNPVIRKDAQKTNMALRSNPGLPLARTPSPNKVRIAGGSSELVKKQTEEPKKDTRNGLQKWFDQAGKDIGNTFNSAKKGVEDAANSVKKWGEGAVNDTKKWVEGAANDTKKWTDNAIKDIGKAAVKMGDDAKKAYGDAEKWVNGAIRDVGNAAVKVGDDAKKAYGDAKTFVDSLLRGEKAVDYVDGRTGKVVKGEGYLPGKIEKAFNSAKDSIYRTAADAVNGVGKAAVKVGDDAKKAYGDAKKWVDTAIGDAKKWTDQAGKDIGKTAADLADDLVYGTKYAIGTAKYAAKNAASKVKDAYERATDTGTQRLLNPKHMTSRQKQAIRTKRYTKEGIAKNLKEGLGPKVNSYDAFKAIDKKTGGRGYDVAARSGEIKRDLAKVDIRPNQFKARALANVKAPRAKMIGPTMSDATKYLNPNELYYYKKGIDYISKFGEGDGSITKELNGYRDKVKREKDRERNR